MDKYHVGIDLAKGDDLGCCVIRKGATLLAEFFGPRCEEQALQWVLTRMDATDTNLAAAQRELAACRAILAECAPVIESEAALADSMARHMAGGFPENDVASADASANSLWDLNRRVAELLAQEGGK